MGIKPFTQEDYLALWRAVLPKFYTDPIENEGEGRGFDVPSSQAAIFARYEAAANVSQQAYFLRPHSIQTGEIARGSAKARGPVFISRLEAGLGSILIPAGTPLEAEQLGSAGEVVSLGRYFLLSAVTMASGAVGPLQATVEAEFPGYTGNLEFPGQIVRFAPQGRATVRVSANSTSRLVRNVSAAEASKWDVFEPQHEGRYVRLVQLVDPLLSSTEPRRVIATWTSGGELGITVTPALAVADVGKEFQVEVEEWADLGLTVVQPQPILGGRSDALGAIATDRGVGRVAGETDDQLADRLLYLEDTISPAAIERIVGAILDPLEISWCLKETADLETLMGFTFDVHPWDVGGLQRITKTANSQLVGQGAVWLGPSTSVRFFIVCIGRSGLGEFGFGFDYTESSAPNAWDVGAYDGSPLGWHAAAGRVWAAVNQARAAGVGFQVLADCC